VSDRIGGPTRDAPASSRRISPALGSYVFAGGVISFLGWALDLQRLTDWDGNGISIQPNATINTLSTGAALLLLHLGRRRIAGFLGWIVALIGAATFFEHLSGLSLGIDTVLMFDRPWGRAGTLWPGRMGPPGSFSWTMVGSALILLSIGHARARRVVPILALAVCAIASLSIIGYLFGADALFTLPRLTTIALQTSTFLLATGMGLLVSVPDREPMRTLLDDSSAGIVARRALPLVILLPIVLGFLRVKGQEAGFYDTAMGTALLTIAWIAVIALALWRGIAAARTSEERLRRTLAFDEAIVKNMGEGLYTLDREGRVTFINPAAEHLFGRTMADLRGQRMHDLTHHTYRDGRPFPAEECAEFQALRQGKALTNYEDWFIHKDGTFFDVVYSSSPMRDAGDVTGSVVVFHDVTERKRAEKTTSFLLEINDTLAHLSDRDQMMRAAGSRIGLFLDVAHCAFVEFDCQAGTATVRYDWRSDSAAPDYAGVYRLADFMSDESRSMLAAGNPLVVQDVASDTRTAATAANHRELGIGSYVNTPYLSNGELTAAIVVFRTETHGWTAAEVELLRELTVRVWSRIDRVRAEQQLQYQLELTRTITDNTQSCLLMMDTQGRGTFANPAAERVTGFSPAELIGEVLHNRIHHTRADGTPFPIDECPLHRALPMRDAVVNYEDTFVHKDGHFYPVRCAGRPIFEGSEPVGTVIEIQDITAEKRLLAAERQARDQAEAANRVKDQFLATLSHELRTPLNAVLGWATILRSGSLLPEKVPVALETIERNARSQTRLVEDLLDVSRIVTGKMQLEIRPVVLATVVEAAVASARLAADAKGVRLQVVLDSRPGTIAGDPERLQQIFWNLISNAIKFTPRGGRVQVRLERINSHIELTVSDTGQGIEAAFLPHVFDRFTQWDGTVGREHGGLGLGLAIVRHLTELHGGEVSAISPGPGKGTTFTVKLPLTIMHHAEDIPDRGDPHIETRMATRDAPRLDGVRILVVDDEPDARGLLTVIFEAAGADVQTAGNMDEALSALEGRHPDVLVSDVGMPNGDGYELIREVRRRNAQSGHMIPAVALTAYARPEDRLKAIASGFQMHVAKPVDGEELLTVTASLAGRLAT
jgi:PAS domain S-box-containing protein